MEPDLASRGNRFLAALVDGLIMLAVLIPVMFLTGGFGGGSSMGYSFMMTLVSIVIFVLINGKSLAANGQTVGKKVMNIKIVAESGAPADVKEHLLKRYGFAWVLGLIPWIGGLLGLVNILLIFGDKRQCGHDMVAKTIVVNA
ncbi:RDD family protein [Hydrogenophaga sp. 5NK40-0174]|uniref:RDD family protein n=1 Tax=Hydrogenophaga sp. 5NK40-0174 TaxID=3127649 RepID=UPI00333E5EBC